MGKLDVVAQLLDDGRLECRIEAPSGLTLTMTGHPSDLEPVVEGGSADLRGNRALIHNAWAYAKFTHAGVSLPSAVEQANAIKRARTHREMAEWLADVANGLTDETKHGWCSGCFAQHAHRKSSRPLGHLSAYVCDSCGTPTLTCAGPRCTNMAVRARGAIRLPQFCAEHRHEIPGFEKASRSMGALEDYAEFLEFDKPHLGRRTRIAGSVLASLPLAAGAAFLAAPAIGGAVGTMVGGYSGAAATSYGLAYLGGGSIASGGLGMAGGTAVVTAAGGALGASLGGSTAFSYLSEDKSFWIDMLRCGAGVPVVVCSGFLSEFGEGWGEWEDIITRRYPDSPVYRVHWGAKELKQLAFLAGDGAIKVTAGWALRRGAAQATKLGAKKLSPLAPVLLAAELAKNPWHVAKNRADKTGVIVADLLARTDAESYVLVGHSLGARAMAVTVQTLGSKQDGGPRIQAAHLLGAAIGAKSDWHTLSAGVDEGVYNYHSANDNVLMWLYKVAQGGQTAAGHTGFTPSVPRIRNVDVSEQVSGHSDYFSRVELL